MTLLGAPSIKGEGDKGEEGEREREKEKREKRGKEENIGPGDTNASPPPFLVSIAQSFSFWGVPTFLIGGRSL